MRKTTFQVAGMDCPDEIAELRERLADVEGIGELSFNLMQSSMTVDHDPTLVQDQETVGFFV
ncbi:MAG TPA: cation transporter [Phycisphaerae bacterium]|nr:cation transporter [Phycisphaerae bacterium]